MKQILRPSAGTRVAQKVYLGVAALLVLGVIVLSLPARVYAACQAPSTDYGSVSSTVAVPAAATYRVWSRVMAPDTTNNSYLLEIDGGTCVNVGGSGLAAGQWVWISHKDGNANSKIDLALTKGNHTIKMIGNKPDVKLDRVIFVSDTSCTPKTSDGNDCNKPDDTTKPNVSLTAPTSGSTVSGTVNVTANASDNVGVTKVEFYIDSQLMASDTSSPYGFSWTTTALQNDDYMLLVKAYDAAGNFGSDSYLVSVKNGDKQAPTVPTGLKATAKAYNKVLVEWKASTDNDAVSSYVVFRDGVPVKTTDGMTLSYEDTALTADTAYGYQVKAVDKSSNSSALSTKVTVKTPTVPDSEAPSAPSHLNATAINQAQVNLSWQASTDNIGVKAYDVYRSVGSGSASKVATVATTSYGDNDLQANTEYQYYVIAVDASNNASDPSEPATAKTPAEPTPEEDTRQGVIRGTVRSERTGKALRGARAVLTVQDHRFIYTTGSKGRYVFRDLEVGRYNVAFRATGYYTKSVSVRVENDTVVRNISLEKR